MSHPGVIPCSYVIHFALRYPGSRQREQGEARPFGRICLLVEFRLCYWWGVLIPLFYTLSIFYMYL